MVENFTQDELEKMPKPDLIKMILYRQGVIKSLSIRNNEKAYLIKNIKIRLSRISKQIDFITQYPYSIRETKK